MRRRRLLKLYPDQKVAAEKPSAGKPAKKKRVPAAKLGL
jgi:hypothetical protein